MYYAKNESFNPNETVVALDKKLLESCDAIVAYVRKPSFGTAMEIKHAFDQQNIIVFLIDPDGNAKNNPWLSYHSHYICETINECSNEIKKLINKTKVRGK